MENIVLHKSESRGHVNHGWLDTYHSFSFASWHNTERIHFGALRVLNDDMVKGGYGFGKHPHDNMEIITVVLKGALEHEDSMGHKQAIHDNEVQVMSAGSGLLHSEYNHNKDEDVNLLQIWIFPDKKNIEPRYDQKVFEEKDRLNKLQVLVAPIDSSDEGLKINQNAWIYRTRLEKGKALELQLHKPQNGLYSFVIEGTAVINGTTVARRDAAGISGKEHFEIVADEDCDLLLIEVPMEI
jgi:redox-sensitive bicupin YhaK (pirin superfamily)